MPFSILQAADAHIRVFPMRLLRYGPVGSEKPGMLDASNCLRDLSSVDQDISGEVLSTAGLQSLGTLNIDSLPIVEDGVRLGPPIANVGKIICVGLNYSDHAAESGMEIPEEPILFFKATTSIVGPNDDVILPVGSSKVDWEVELGVVIGERASYVAESAAMEHVAGYCVVNDVSERAFQLERGGQWVKGKSCDSFAPIGPWLVTSDEIADPHKLSMTLEVNGRRFQNGSTSTMIFRIPFLVSYISKFMTLEPGDIISTGTPPGVGLGQNPPVYLKLNDVIDLEIEFLGRQRQNVIAYPSDSS